jgi:C_GCAxxG_C_C family probable redox protein
MFEIRRALASDLPAVRQLVSLCAPAHRLIDDDPDPAPGSAIYVASANAHLVGCAGFDVIGGSHALIRSLAVLPGFRKQQIGRHLMQRLLVHAGECGVHQLFLLTDRAREYFVQMGFVSCSPDCVPEPVRMSPRFRALLHPGAVILHHASDDSCADRSPATLVAADAKRQFDAGYYCAESVLLALGRELEIESELLPAIATGFSNGVSRTWGTCGAVNGAVLGLNLAFGRRSPGDPVEPNYRAVRGLIGEFSRLCGSTQCSELLACDLDTPEGQRIYKSHNLRVQCREYVGIAARLASGIIAEQRGGTAVPAASTTVAEGKTAAE